MIYKLDYKNKIKLYLEKINNWNITSDILYELSFCYFEIGNLYKSLFYANKLINFDKSLYRGYELLLLNFDHIWNITKLSKVLSFLDRKNYDSELFYLIKWKFYRDKWKEVISMEIFNNWLIKYPKSFLLIYNLALVYYKLNNYKMSLDLVDKWLKINSNYKYFIYLKLKILRRNSKKEVFAKYLKEILINLEYDTYNAKYDLVVIWNIFYELGKNKLAIHFYKKSFLFIKNDYYAYNGLWNCYYKLGNYEKAIDYYNIAKKINNNNYYTYNGLWNCYYKLGNYEKAISYYKYISFYNYNAKRNLNKINKILWL